MLNLSLREANESGSEFGLRIHEFEFMTGLDLFITTWLQSLIDVAIVYVEEVQRAGRLSLWVSFSSDRFRPGNYTQTLTVHEHNDKVARSSIGAFL